MIALGDPYPGCPATAPVVTSGLHGSAVTYNSVSTKFPFAECLPGPLVGRLGSSITSSRNPVTAPNGRSNVTTYDPFGLAPPIRMLLSPSTVEVVPVGSEIEPGVSTVQFAVTF